LETHSPLPSSLNEWETRKSEWEAQERQRKRERLISLSRRLPGVLVAYAIQGLSLHLASAPLWAWVCSLAGPLASATHFSLPAVDEALSLLLILTGTCSSFVAWLGGCVALLGVTKGNIGLIGQMISIGGLVGIFVGMKAWDEFYKKAFPIRVDRWQLFLMMFGVPSVGLGLGWLLRLTFPLAP
jgi:hypothetical protein